MTEGDGTTLTITEKPDGTKSEVVLDANGRVIKDKDEISNYYWHNVSHPLGLDTHDMRGSLNTIEENMVITVEPGLYIAETKTGIRIEDDVYVTKKGNIVLTDKVPKEIKDIEEIITEKKY